MDGFLDPGKSVPMKNIFRWLGIQKKLARDRVQSHICPKRRDNLISMIDSFLKSREMTSAQAATLRGKLGFIANSLYGKTGRMALTALKMRQYKEEKEIAITEGIVQALKWVGFLIFKIPPALSLAGNHSRPHVILFTDASSEESTSTLAYARSVILGWVAFENLQAFHAGYTKIDHNVLSYWKKKQPIYQGECLAVLQALLHILGVRKNIDITIYVDNLGTLGTFVRGSSAKDVFGDQLSNALHLLLAMRGCRCWFEYVPTNLNPADQPSRECKSDYFADCKHYDLATILLPTSTDDHLRFGINRSFTHEEIQRYEQLESTQGRKRKRALVM